MSDRLERVLTVVMTVTAVSIAVVVVRREFFASAVAGSREALAQKSELVPTWRDAVSAGISVGPANAPVTVVEFTDIECPVCRGFDLQMREIRKKYPNDIKWIFVHFPLPQHRFARLAAHVVECADKYGRVDQAVELLFRKQDSLGLKPWRSYAREAGIRDSTAFARCLDDKSFMARVDSGRAVGQRLSVKGTPTVILNGWRYGIPPSVVEMSSRIDSLLAAGRAR